MPIEIKAGKYFSTTEAAEELDCSDGRIRQLISSNELEAIRIGERSFLIPAEAVAHRKANPATLGRPPRKAVSRKALRKASKN